jgi:hypothetical protein
MSLGAQQITAERERQITEEGWTDAVDDRYTRGQLIDGGLSYIHAAINTGHSCLNNPPRTWRWDAKWWKPSRCRIRNLVKAGALIAAEIDRLERAKAHLVKPQFVVGQHLFTRDGRMIGNAIITEVTTDGMIRMETDFGNGGSLLNFAEVTAWWHTTDEKGQIVISDVAQWRADRNSRH